MGAFDVLTVAFTGLEPVWIVGFTALIESVEPSPEIFLVGTVTVGGIKSE